MVSVRVSIFVNHCTLHREDERSWEKEANVFFLHPRRAVLFINFCLYQTGEKYFWSEPCLAASR